MDTVRRTYESEHYNKTPERDRSLIFWGGVSAALGILFFADANGLSNDQTSPKEVQGVGITFMAIGGLLLVGAGVDAIRASGHDERTEDVVQQGDVLRSDLPCSDRPLADAPVLVAGSGAPTAVGRTAADGTADVDLSRALPLDDILAAPDSKIAIIVGDNTVGHVPNKATVEAFDEATWSKVDVFTCRTENTQIACVTVADYLRRFPSGRHAQSAHQIIAELEQKVVERTQKAEAEAHAREAEQERQRHAAEAAAAAAATAQRARANCRAQCSAACKGNPTCASQCVASKCP